jgi:hypothetical protein
MEIKQNTAVHPSRLLPQCHKCAHQISAREPYASKVEFFCDHPSLPISETNGLPEVTCIDARLGSCGKNGVLFTLVGQQSSGVHDE